MTWLPGRILTRTQAVAAMELAEMVPETQDDCDPEVYDETFWSRAGEHAGQLGLSGPGAIGQAVDRLALAPRATSRRSPISDTECKKSGASRVIKV